MVIKDNMKVVKSLNCKGHPAANLFALITIINDRKYFDEINETNRVSL